METQDSKGVLPAQHHSVSSSTDIDVDQLVSEIISKLTVEKTSKSAHSDKTVFDDLEEKVRERLQMTPNFDEIMEKLAEEALSLESPSMAVSGAQGTNIFQDYENGSSARETKYLVEKKDEVARELLCSSVLKDICCDDLLQDVPLQSQGLLLKVIASSVADKKRASLL